MFQEFSLFPWMSVTENIEFSWGHLRRIRRGGIARAMAALELVGLSAFKGARRRAIRRHETTRGHRSGFGHGLEVLLMDEPFCSLTSRPQAHGRRSLALWKMGGKGVLFITHSIEEQLSCGPRWYLYLIPGKDCERMEDWARLARLRDSHSAVFESLRQNVGATEASACAQSSRSIAKKIIPMTLEDGTEDEYYHYLQ